jgi:hypothetical protein
MVLGMIVRESSDRISTEGYLQSIRQQLSPLGFNVESTLACVSTCRDELCQPFVEEVKNSWGEAFDLNGLGGIPIGGLTAVTAASHHAPEVDGKRRILFIGLAHVALGADGTIGDVERLGTLGPSRACGALVRFCEELSEVHADESPPIDSDDIEYSNLRNKLLRNISVYGDESQSLWDITLRAEEEIFSDLTRLAKEILDPTVYDYSINTGILIHMPDGSDLVEPHHSIVVLDGKFSSN